MKKHATSAFSLALFVVLAGCSGGARKPVVDPKKDESPVVKRTDDRDSKAIPACVDFDAEANMNDYERAYDEFFRLLADESAPMDRIHAATRELLTNIESYIDGTPDEMCRDRSGTYVVTGPFHKYREEQKAKLEEVAKITDRSELNRGRADLWLAMTAGGSPAMNPFAQPTTVSAPKAAVEPTTSEEVERVEDDEILPEAE